MPPVMPGQPVAPAPTTVAPTGVQAVAPAPAPVAPQMPAPAGLQNGTFAPPAIPAPSGPTPQSIANYYQIPEQARIAGANAQALGNEGQQEFEREKAQGQLTAEHLKDQLDPSKYTINNDPAQPQGVRITNSLGQQVDLGTYVNLTGANPASVVAKSTSPAAQKFVTAYNNLQDLMQTTLSASQGDEQAKIKLGEYYSANPGLEKMTASQVSNAFLQQYGSFFGMPNQASQYNQLGNAPNVSPTLTSQNNPITSSPYYELQQYPGLNQPNPITSSMLGSAGGGGISQLLQSTLQPGG